MCDWIWIWRSKLVVANDSHIGWPLVIAMTPINHILTDLFSAFTKMEMFFCETGDLKRQHHHQIFVVQWTTLHLGFHIYQVWYQKWFHCSTLIIIRIDWLAYEIFFIKQSLPMENIWLYRLKYLVTLFELSGKIIWDIWQCYLKYLTITIRWYHLRYPAISFEISRLYHLKYLAKLLKIFGDII